MRVRDRIAPRPNVGVGIEGWIRWEKVSRGGIITAAGEQHNLLLNAGLDMFASQGMNVRNGVGAYGAVGTGSTTPDVTDVALDAELARSAVSVNSGGTVVSPGVLDDWTEIEFDFAAGNGNLTEWGFAPASTGDLAVRELFRDDLGDPITITKTSSEKLRIKYTVRYTCGPIVPVAAAVPITGLGTINGKHCLTAGAWSSIIDFCMRGFTGSGYTGPQFRYVNTGAYAAGFDYDSTISNGNGPYATAPTFGGYVAGSHERVIGPWELSTAQGNGEHHGWSIHQNSTSTVSRVSGWAFIFDDDGSTFTKDDLHMLDIDMGKITWARA